MKQRKVREWENGGRGSVIDITLKLEKISTILHQNHCSSSPHTFAGTQVCVCALGGWGWVCMCVRHVSYNLPLLLCVVCKQNNLQTASKQRIMKSLLLQKILKKNR